MVNEAEKWDKFYTDIDEMEQPSCLLELGDEIIQSLDVAVKKTDTILEAGCGSGVQSLAIYRAGYKNIALLDFSKNALRAAKSVFKKDNPDIRTIKGDLKKEDASQGFDLVYNCGVLEHYEKNDRIDLLKGMASRSDNLVLVLIPNVSCYWYWIWRIHTQSKGNWVFGKELAGIDVVSDFKKAGISYLGNRYFGKKWTNQFIDTLKSQKGVNADLADSIVQLHDKNIVPPASQAYLIGFLGTVDPNQSRISLPAWKKKEYFAYNNEVISCAMADSIASNVYQQSNYQQQISEMKQRIRDLSRTSVPKIELESLKSRFEKLTSDHKAVMTEKDELVTNIESRNKEYDKLTAHAKAQNKQIDDLSVFIKTQSEQIDELTDNIECRIKEYDKLTAHAKAQDEQIRELLECTKSQSEQIDNLNIQQERLRADHHAVTAEKDNLTAMNDQLVMSLESARQHDQAVQHELDGIRSQKVKILALVNTASNKLQELKKRKGVKVAKLLNYINWNVLKGSVRQRLHGLAALCKRTASPNASLTKTHFLDDLDVPLKTIRYHCLASAKPQPKLPPIDKKKQGRINEDNPLVSIVLPVYNQADLLANSIDSVIKQSCENWELLVINDGSTDNVEAVFQQYADNPKILLLTQNNQQLPKALSNAFQFAAGKYITWTSADNLMHPEQIERLLAYLQTNQDVDMVYSDYYAIDDSGQMLTDPQFRPHNRTEPQNPEIHLPRDPSPINQVADNFIGASFMYRRSAMNIIGEYDPQLGVEDYDYWMRINALLTIKHLGTDELLYYYRVHDNSLNARAKELKIFDAVSQLMSYEKQRGEYYSTGFDIICSREFIELSPKRFPIRSLTQFATNSRTGNSTSEKKLLLVSAADIPIAYLEADNYDCICAWFNEDDSNLIYKYQYQIDSGIDACFCPENTRAFERLNIIHPKVIDCRTDNFMDLAIAFANNHLFYDKTHSSQQRQRIVPEVFGKHNRKRVMLQMDQYSYGGMEQVLIDVAETLVDTDSEVFICICNPSDSAPKLADDRIKLLFVDPDNKLASYKALLHDNQIDIVNAHYSTFGADICYHMAIPFVQTIHNMYVWFDDEQKERYRKNDVFTQAYICVSNNVAWYTNEILQLPEAKTLVINNGIDTDLFRYDPKARDEARRKFGFGQDDYVLLNLASVYAVKGQKHLVEAFATASKTCPNLKLIIAGNITEPPYYEQIVKTINEKGLSDNVIHGKRFENTVELCHAADALVMPSFWEGCSLAIAECVAMGLPVLSTRVGDVENQTNMQNCIVLDLPLDLLTDMDKINLPKLLYKTQTELVTSIAESIVSLCNNHSRQLSDISGQKMDRTRAYGKYDKLFDLILAGAKPRSARKWLRQQNNHNLNWSK